MRHIHIVGASECKRNDAISTIGGENGVVIGWQGMAAATYSVQMRATLAYGSWSNITESISGLDGIMSVTNTTTLPVAFFRLIRHPSRGVRFQSMGRIRLGKPPA